MSNLDFGITSWSDRAATILLVDHLDGTHRSVGQMLASEGHTVVNVADGRQAIAELERLRPSLVLLEPALPNLNGLELCRRIVRDAQIPVIIVSERARDSDKVLGLDAGADDYVTKPFNARELTARIRALLRRYRPSLPGQTVLQVGSLTVDTALHRAALDARPLDLSPREFDLLAAFARQPEVALSREILLDRVWGSDFLGDPRTLDVHVTWLRHKLARGPARIEAVRGIGYKLVDRPGHATETVLAGSSV